MSLTFIERRLPATINHPEYPQLADPIPALQEHDDQFICEHDEDYTRQCGRPRPGRFFCRSRSWAGYRNYSPWAQPFSGIGKPGDKHYIPPLSNHANINDDNTEPPPGEVLHIPPKPSDEAHPNGDSKFPPGSPSSRSTAAGSDESGEGDILPVGSSRNTATSSDESDGGDVVPAGSSRSTAASSDKSDGGDVSPAGPSRSTATSSDESDGGNVSPVGPSRSTAASSDQSDSGEFSPAGRSRSDTGASQQETGFRMRGTKSSAHQTGPDREDAVQRVVQAFHFLRENKTPAVAEYLKRAVQDDCPHESWCHDHVYFKQVCEYACAQTELQMHEGMKGSGQKFSLSAPGMGGGHDSLPEVDTELATFVSSDIRRGLLTWDAEGENLSSHWNFARFLQRSEAKLSRCTACRLRQNLFGELLALVKSLIDNQVLGRCVHRSETAPRKGAKGTAYIVSWELSDDCRKLLKEPSEGDWHDLVKNLGELLRTHKIGHGISLSNLHQRYLSRFKRPFRPQDFGYSSLSAMFQDPRLSPTFRIFQKKDQNTSMRVELAVPR